MKSNLQKQNFFNGLVLAALSALLVACGANDGDDIDHFIQDGAKGLSPKIEATPQAQAYSPMAYNADGTLGDPFKSRKLDANQKGLRPDLTRPKAPLEAYPLEGLKFVGLISKANLRYALIKAPDNSVQAIKLGNFVGQNYGVVTEIREDGITLKEIVQDEVTGDWKERSAMINAQD
jgi:type IV pilus assembly protein PilP